MISNLINKVLALCCDPNSQSCQPPFEPCPGGFGIGGGFKVGGVNNPLKFDNLTDLLIFIGEKLYFLSIPILTIMILYGAFQILTAAGDETKFEVGKRTVLYAIIGFVVILIAGGIPSLIESFKVK